MLHALDIVVRFLVEQLEHDQQDAADEQRRDDYHRVAHQVLFDQLVEDEPDHGRRNESGRDAFHDFEISEESLPVKRQDRKDGARLDRDDETFCELGFDDAEKVAGED